MKNILLTISLVCLSTLAFSQSISGVINNYAAVTDIASSACFVDITVDDATPFSVGDSILIIQMQGATADLSNTASFGDLTAIGSAGKYEKAEIVSVTGNVIGLTAQLVNAYDVAGAVQIVSVPHYTLNQTVTATLTADPWDGSKGGVLAFTAASTITLNADIDVSGLGFRGGVDAKLGNSSGAIDELVCVVVSNGCVGTDYFYPAASSYAVAKGEGIGQIPIGYEGGRGKFLNAGGGGGMSYGGGGGGSNYGAGGAGGGCNDGECSNFCPTCNEGLSAGLGAQNFAAQYNNVQNRIFLGGGGGAGNHGQSTGQYFNLPERDGENGGGIVMISADQIVGNGNSIIANGADGVTLPINQTGGTGGGGGGGTVLLKMNNPAIALTVNVAGGRGNDANIIGSTTTTAGAGGGGGGGVIWSNLVVSGVVPNVAFGVPGISRNGAGVIVGPTWQGSAGSSGSSISGLAFPVGSVPTGAGPPLTVGFLTDTIDLCEGQDYPFNLAATAGQSYQWQIDSNSNGNFVNLENGVNYDNVDTNNTFIILNVDTTMDGSSYQLVVYNACDSITSSPIYVNVVGLPSVTVQSVSQTSCVGGNALFYVEAEDGLTYQWQNLSAGGNISDNANYSGTNTDSLTITNIPASMNGNIFRVIVTNPCGSVFSNPAFLNFTTNPITIDDFSVDITACEGADTFMFVEYTGNVDSIRWQVDDSGTGFVDLTNNASYQGVNMDTLQLLNIPLTSNGNIYRVILSNGCGTTTTSANVDLSVSALNVTSNDTIFGCQGQNLNINAFGNGVNIMYQWQIDTSGTWEDLTNVAPYSGVNSTILVVNGSIVDTSINNNNYRVFITTDCGNDTSDIIYPSITPSPVFTLQPVNDTVCPGDTAIFYATVSGGLSYQWQSNEFGPFSNIFNGPTYGGVTTDSLSIFNVTAGLDGVVYRLRVQGNTPCGMSPSANAQLFIGGEAINVTGQSSDLTVCPNIDTILYVNYIGDPDTIIWQVDDGSGFVNLSNGGFYGNVDSDTLDLINVDPFFLDGNIYRALVSNSCGDADSSASINLNFYGNISVIKGPDAAVCEGDSAMLYVQTSGPVASMTWQIFNGAIYTDIVPNSTYQISSSGDTLFIHPTTLAMDFDEFLVVATDSCGNTASSLPIYLFVNPNIQDSIPVTLCSGDSLMLSDGTFVNTVGTYYDSIPGTGSDCDTLITYDLSFYPVAQSNSSETICFGDSVMLSDGSFVNATGVYNDTLSGASSNGCDSINIIDLTVSPQITGNDPQTICFGDSFMLSDGSFVNATGVYNDTITGAASNGCDSVNIVDLTVSPQITGNDPQTICFGDSFMLSDGSFVNATGTYNDTLTAGASNGCDSVNIVDLTVSPQITENDPQTICFGDSFMLSDGSFVNATGTYNDTLTAGASNGCDSVNIVDLTVSPQITGNDPQTICFGDSFMLSDGSFVNATGTYNDTLTAGASNGCDSVNIVDLTVSPQITGNDPQTICFGDSFMLSDGSYVNATGTYNDTLTAGASNGCDSVNIVDLTVSPQITGNDPQTICFGDSFMLSDGSYVNATGTYNDTLTAGASNGCDSVNIVDLTVSPQITGNDPQTICFGDSFMLSDGSFVNATGTYNDTLTAGASNGCDSVNIVDLTVSPQITGNDPQTICFGDSFMLSDGSFVNATGTYNDTLAAGASNGCDSVNIVDLTISPLVTSMLVDSFCSGGTYTLASGAVVDSAGTYNDTLVAASANGCDSVITYDLSLQSIFVPSQAIVDTLCAGDIYTFPSGDTTSFPGMYNDTLTGSNGCDSIVVFDIQSGPTNSFSQQFADLNVCIGTNVLYYLITPDSTLSYQWIINGVDVPGETTDSLFLASVTAAMDSDVIQLRASGRCDTVVSDTSILTIIPQVVITADPIDMEVCVGDSAGFSISTAMPVQGYLWYENGVGLAGTNDSIFTIPVTSIAQDGNQYFVEIIDSCGQRDTSLVATLTVNQFIENTNEVICFGDSLQLSDGSFVNATGIYNDTLVGGAANGCDSINIIDLTVSPQITGNDPQVICFGDSFMLSDGSFVNATGTYNDTLSNGASNGCDSVNIVDLTVSPQITGNDVQVICFGDSFMLSNGSFVNATGTYNDTLANGASNGCDSVNIVDLTVSPQITGNDPQTICFGDSFMLSDGSFVNATGTYNDTLTNGASNGCDSVNIVDLTVSPQITGNDVQVICFGDSFMLSDGSFVNATGTYNDTLTGGASNGCDSVSIIDLTISPQITGNDTQVLCFGDSLMLSDGSFANATGTYNDTLTNGASNGCDSVIIIDLTISPQITGNDTQVLCFGDSLMLSDGSFVNATGTYNDTLTGGASNGCDSVNIIDLTISPQITGNDTQVLCFGDSLMLSDGSFANVTGTYNDTVVGGASNGCDSVNIIDLTISPQITENDTQVICFGDSIMLSDGSFVNATGIYNDTLVGGANNSCDSVHIIDLTVSPLVTSNDTQVLCFGDSLQLSDGSFVNSSGIYNDTLVAATANGCDSINIIDLTISPQITQNDTQVICFGDSLQLSDGSFVNSTGIYNDTITGGAANGCDSVNIVDLTVSPQITGNDTQVICFGDSLMLSDGSFVNATGTYNDTITGGASNGCDSVNIVDLTVSPQITGNDTQVLCFGDSLMLSDGSFVNATGTYNDTITGGAFNGCDSVNIIDLTISPQITGNDTQVLCFGDSLMLSNGSFVNATGTYNDTITGGAFNGCDSVNIIDLTISPQISGNDTQVLCFGDSLMLSDGSFVNTTGTFNDTITGGASNGCDSVVIIDLTISPIVMGNDTQVLCFGDSLMLSDGTFVNSTGAYNDTIAAGAANGCDSLNIIDLTILPANVTNDTTVLCFGDSLQLSDGSFVNATGIYNDTLTAGGANGCDSVNVIDLTISPLVTSNDTQVLCFGDSLQLSDGSFVNSTGIYNDTLVGASSNGCDSINIIDLTISPLITSNDTQVLCFGDSLQLSDGSFVHATGTYNDTLISGATNGCDSVNIIDLTISPQITGNDTQVLCFGDSLMLSDGSFVNATGTYNDTIAAGGANGCDSVNIIDLTISPQITGNDTQVLCFGDSLMLSDGSFVNTTGTYNDTIAAGGANGCDSVNIIDLTISPQITGNDTQVLCFGDSLMLSDGSFVNATGTYNDTIIGGASNACDSVNIIDLTIAPLLIGTDTQTICSGDSFQLMNGLFVNATGIYNDTLVNGAANGCDTIIQVDLTVLPNPTSMVVDSFCAGGDYILASGAIVDTAGIYNDTLFASAANGCDSIVIYDLSIIAAFVPSPPVNDTICFNETYTLPSGIVVDTAGIYNDTIQSASGCDSIFVVDLVVRPANSILQQSNNLLLCISDTATFFVETSDSTATYQWTFNGVDVIGGTDDTLVLPNVNAGNDGTIVQVRVMGICDTIFSLATLLNVRDVGAIVTDPIDMTVCAGDSAGFSVTTNIPVASFEWFENGIAIPGSNSSSFTIPATTLAQDSNQYFCVATDSCGTLDSSLVATLFVNPNAQIFLQSIDLTVCAGDDALFFVTASGTNVNYQWLLDGAAIPGETSDSLNLLAVLPGMDGNVYSCQLTSDCGNLTTNDMLLTVNDTSIVSEQSVDIIQCGGFSFDVFIDATNIATYQWQIDQGAGFVNLVDGPLGANGTQIAGATTSMLTVSNYDLSISGAQYQVITTVFCGTAPIFTPVTVTITSPEVITDKVEDTVLCLLDVSPIFVPYVDASALWSNGDFGQFFEPTTTGNYIVEFTDQNSCPQSDTIFVQVDDCVAQCVVVAPTGFTPNGSGANDIFRGIYTCELSFFEMQVRNRYGELVFFTNEPLEGWDGVYKGVNAEVGTYTWYISYQKEGADRKEDVKGNVTLIR